MLRLTGVLPVMTTWSGPESGPWFPATSRARAVKLYVPGVNVLLVMVQAPVWALDVVEPTTTALASNSTMALGIAVPLKVGVVSVVLLSVLDGPVSDAGSRSGTDGAVGAVVSMVTDNAPDWELVLFPIVARAVKLYVLSGVIALVVTVH